jgi:hypothetical protein
MIFNNTELRKDAVRIAGEGLAYSKGTASGFSIEVEEDGSSSSYVYYQDEKSRDKDFELLNIIAENLK